jgi:hypothetical protein
MSYLPICYTCDQMIADLAMAVSVTPTMRFCQACFDEYVDAVGRDYGLIEEKGGIDGPRGEP